MATKFVTNLDLVQNQIINGRFESLSSDPNTGNFEGRLIYNTTEGTLKYFDGTAWQKAIISIDSVGSSSAALTINESNGSITIEPNLATSSDPGVMSASDKSKLDDASASDGVNTLVKRDGDGRFQVAAPSDPLDAANKAYVDAARSGLDVKESVHVATTGPINLATDLQAGDVIDGHTLNAGDRVLVKDQVTASENGIYVAVASGAASRSADADTSGEVTSGLFTFVTQGTDNGDTGWVLTTDGPITLGSTGLTFTQFSGTGQIIAGEALEKDGATLNVLVDGTSIEVVSDELRIASGAAGAGLDYDNGELSVSVHVNGGLEISSGELQIKVDGAVSGLETTSAGLHLTGDIAGDGLTFTAGVLSRDTIDLGQGSNDTTGTLPLDQGGTDATSAEEARYTLAQGSSSGRTTSNPVLARIVYQVIGNNSDTSFDIYHNFGTRHVMTQVYDTNSYDTVIADVSRPTTDKVNVQFSVAPDNNEYTVVVTGWEDWF